MCYTKFDTKHGNTKLEAFHMWKCNIHSFNTYYTLYTVISECTFMKHDNIDAELEKPSDLVKSK